MKRRSDGKYILSAGEIASYTVCPEAWRLSREQAVTPLHVKSVEEGSRLHKEWTRSMQDAAYFSRGVRLILMMAFLSVAFFLIHFVVKP